MELGFTDEDVVKNIKHAIVEYLNDTFQTSLLVAVELISWNEDITAEDVIGFVNGIDDTHYDPIDVTYRGLEFEFRWEIPKEWVKLVEEYIKQQQKIEAAKPVIKTAAELRVALEFYADKSAWESGDVYSVSKAELDKGRFARKVLA